MKKKYVVNYGDIDIHKGAASFWIGFLVVIFVCVLIAGALM